MMMPMTARSARSRGVRSTTVVLAAGVAIGSLLSSGRLAAQAFGEVRSAPAAAPTFSKDVAPILYKNCTTCHRPGGIGPKSFLSYEVVAEIADDIRDAVYTAYMPPWHADAPH